MATNNVISIKNELCKAIYAGLSLDRLKSLEGGEVLQSASPNNVKSLIISPVAFELELHSSGRGARFKTYKTTSLTNTSETVLDLFVSPRVCSNLEEIIVVPVANIRGNVHSFNIKEMQQIQKLATKLDKLRAVYIIGNAEVEVISKFLRSNMKSLGVTMFSDLPNKFLTQVGAKRIYYNQEWNVPSYHLRERYYAIDAENGALYKALKERYDLYKPNDFANKGIEKEDVQDKKGINPKKIANKTERPDRENKSKEGTQPKNKIERLTEEQRKRCVLLTGLLKYFKPTRGPVYQYTIKALRSAEFPNELNEMLVKHNFVKGDENTNGTELDSLPTVMTSYVAELIINSGLSKYTRELLEQFIKLSNFSVSAPISYYEDMVKELESFYNHGFYRILRRETDVREDEVADNLYRIINQGSKVLENEYNINIKGIVDEVDNKTTLNLFERGKCDLPNLRLDKEMSLKELVGVLDNLKMVQETLLTEWSNPNLVGSNLEKMLFNMEVASYVLEDFEPYLDVTASITRKTRQNNFGNMRYDNIRLVKQIEDSINGLSKDKRKLEIEGFKNRMDIFIKEDAMTPLLTKEFIEEKFSILKGLLDEYLNEPSGSTLQYRLAIFTNYLLYELDNVPEAQKKRVTIVLALRVGNTRVPNSIGMRLEKRKVEVGRGTQQTLNSDSYPILSMLENSYPLVNELQFNEWGLYNTAVDFGKSPNSCESADYIQYILTLLSCTINSEKGTKTYKEGERE